MNDFLSIVAPHMLTMSTTTSQTTAPQTNSQSKGKETETITVEKYDDNANSWSSWKKDLVQAVENASSEPDKAWVWIMRLSITNWSHSNLMILKALIR